MSEPIIIVNGVNLRSLLHSMCLQENTTRRRAEAEWEQLVPITGVARGLLAVATSAAQMPMEGASSEDISMSMNVTKLCFILLKNNLKKFSHEDVIFIQDNILGVLASCADPSLSRLVAGLAVGIAILHGGQWETLYKALEAMLASDPVTESDKICSALVCVSELCSMLPADVLSAYVNISASLINVALNPTSAKSAAAFAATADSTVTTTSAGGASGVSGTATPPMAPLDAPLHALFANSGAASIAKYARTHPYSLLCQQMALRAIADMALVVGLTEGHTLALVCTSAYEALVAIGAQPIENDALLNQVSHEALKIASIVADFQPNVATPESFVKVMGALSQSADIYQYVVTDEEYAVDDAVIDSVCRCSRTRWGFVAGFFRSKTRANAVYGVIGNSYAELAAIALRYCVLSRQQSSDWVLDPNAFLKGEDDRDDQVSTVVRDTAAEACEQLIKRGGADVWVELFSTCKRTLAVEAGGVGGGASVTSWRLREAALFLLADCIQRRMAIIKTAPAEIGSALFELAGSVAATDLAAGVNQFLVIRALLFFRTVVHSCAAIMPVQQIALQLLSPAVHTLQAPSSSSSSSDTLLPACAAVLLLSRIISKCPKPAVAQSAPAALSTILALAARTDHELLYVLLELTLSWLKCCGSVAVSHIDCAVEIPNVVLSVWQRNLDDPNVAELVVDLFGFILKRCPQSHSGFIPTVLPWMASTLGGLESLTAMCSIPSVLSIVRDMVKYGADGVITSIGNVLLGALCRLLLNTEDSGVANAASNALAFLIKRLGQAVFHCTVLLPPSHLRTLANDGADDGGIPPLDEEDEAVPVSTAMQAIACKMLSPSTREFTLLNAGKFLKELVPVVAASNGLARFLCTLVDRALLLQMDSTFQELMLPIAQILAEQCQAALAALDNSNRLVPFFEKWLPKQKVFFGKDVLASTTVALAAVLDTVGVNADGSDVGGRNVRLSKKKGAGVVALRLAVFVTLGKQLDAALKSKSKEFKSDSEEEEGNDLESLDSDEDPADFDDEDEDYDEFDPNDCSRDPYATADGDEDEESEGDEEEEVPKNKLAPNATASASDAVVAKKKGPSVKYIKALERFGAFVQSLGPAAAHGGHFAPKEIERLQKALSSGGHVQ